jgi:hypothetical protein
MALETELTLPSGGTVTMRDPNFLRSRDRNEMIRKVNGPDAEGKSDIDKGLYGIQVMAGIMITDWLLPYEPEDNADGSPRAWTLPKNDPSIMDELYAADTAVIEEKLVEARKVLMPQAASAEQHEDPESPSGPESA